MTFFWQAVLIEGGLAVLAVLADLLFRLQLNYWQYCWCDVQTIKQITLGLFPLIVGYFVLLALPLESLRQIDRFVRELFWQYMGHWKIWQLALVAALAGIGEELFFRGLLQLGLANILDIWVAIFITSLIFGLAHAVTPTYFLLSFIVSLYFGWLFVHTENLVVPIAIHALYDFAVLMYIRYSRRPPACKTEKIEYDITQRN